MNNEVDSVTLAKKGKKTKCGKRSKQRMTIAIFVSYGRRRGDEPLLSGKVINHTASAKQMELRIFDKFLILQVQSLGCKLR